MKGTFRVLLVVLLGVVIVNEACSQTNNLSEETSGDAPSSLSVFGTSLSSAGGDIIVGQKGTDKPWRVELGKQIQSISMLDATSDYGFDSCFIHDGQRMRLTCFLFLSHKQTEKRAEGDQRKVGEFEMFHSGHLGLMSEHRFKINNSTKDFLMYKKPGIDSPAMIVIDGKGWRAEGHEFYYVDVNVTPLTIQAIPMKVPDQALGSSGLIELAKSIAKRLESGELKLAPLPAGNADDGAWANKIKAQAAEIGKFQKEFNEPVTDNSTD